MYYHPASHVRNAHMDMIESHTEYLDQIRPQSNTPYIDLLLDLRIAIRVYAEIVMLFMLKLLSSTEVFNLFYTVDPTDIPSSGGGPP